MPKVSVIIPVYNVEDYLPQCLDSVINQTLKDIEIICVDDGSTDSSYEILKDYTQKDNRIKLIKQKNKHAGVARNRGLKIAKGEYIHFLDADDWLELNAYEILYGLISETCADLVKFRAYSYDNKTSELVEREYLNIAWIDQKYINNTISIDIDLKNTLLLPDSPWSGFYKRDFLIKNKIYFDNFLCVNDVGFFYRCVVAAKKIYVSSEKLLYYRENNEKSLIGIRVNNFQYNTALYDVVKKICKNFPQQKQFIFKNQIINDIINRYSKYKRSDISAQISYRLDIEMSKLVKKLSNEKLDEVNFTRYKKIEQKLNEFDEKEAKRKREQLFSMKNIGVHKVITIFGIKLKIKSKKLVERQKKKEQQ